MRDRRLRRKSQFGIAFPLAMLMCSLACAAFAQSSANPPELLPRSIGCLVAKDYIQNTLADLGLRVNNMAWVRFHQGSIRGFDPTPDEIQIAEIGRAHV